MRKNRDLSEDRIEKEDEEERPGDREEAQARRELVASADLRALWKRRNPNPLDFLFLCSLCFPLLLLRFLCPFI